MQTTVQSRLAPVVECAASHGVARRETATQGGASEGGQTAARAAASADDESDPYVIASLAPSFSIEDTSLPSLRERFQAPEQAASLIVLGGTGDGDSERARAAARAIETIVGYFQLAQPLSSRAPQSSLPGLRGGLRQALEMGRERNARVQHGDLDLAVAYLAFPRLYLATLGRMGCSLLRGGQLLALAPAPPDDTAGGGPGRAHLRGLIDRALGRAAAEATHVRRIALRRGDRLALSTERLAQAALAPSIASVLVDAVDAQTAARALQELLQAVALGRPATVVVAQIR